MEAGVPAGGLGGVQYPRRCRTVAVVVRVVVVVW
jgi:hypothetical protein